MKIRTRICWKETPGELFSTGTYNRVHHWFFDGGSTFRVSASPDIVPRPFSDPSLIDPEEAFVASLSSCHMLLFLSVAARKKFVVLQYEDNAEARMEKNADGKLFVAEIKLKPQVDFSPDHLPDENTIRDLHHLAHKNCFLANSVKSKIIIV